MRDIGDVRLALEGAFEAAVAQPATVPTEAVAAPFLGWRQALPWVVVCLFLGGGITGIIVTTFFRSVPMPQQVPSRFVVTTPAEGPVGEGGPNRDVAVSPDGTRVVYTSGNTILGNELYTRQVGDLDAAPLRGTLGAANSFFSPDGEWVGFRDARDNTLKRVSASGGFPVTMCDCDIPVSFRGASWGPDDMWFLRRRAVRACCACRWSEVNLRD